MGEARRRRGRAPGPLPRGTCPVCGNEFALRGSRTLGQHQRRTAQGYRIGRCPGVDQPPVGPETVDNTVTDADVTAGQTPEITISSATEDTDPEPRSTPVHDVTTETRLRALDEKITPLYEYLGQHHAADIAPGEGPIEMALRLLREQDARLQASPSNATPADREDQQAADRITVSPEARAMLDELDRKTGARHVPLSRAHSRARDREPTAAAWERIPYVERLGRLWAGCATGPLALLSEKPDDDPVPDLVWDAVVDVVPITAVTAALANPDHAAWNVCSLVERGVRAALAAVDQAARTKGE